MARTRLGIVTTDTDEIIDVGTADPSLPTDVGVLLASGALASVARTASVRASAWLSARSSSKRRSPSRRRSSRSA